MIFDGFSSLECGGSSLINNATCYGDVTAFTATIAVCNERHLVNASDLVEITGSLRLTFLSSDISTLSFENLAVIGQDLYVSDVDATTTTLSFPSLGNVSGSITFSSASIETVELSALRVCGSLSASSGSATSLYFPLLEEVFGAMSFSGSGIRTIELPSLLVVDGTASFSSLYSMGSILMPAVRTIGGGFSISNWCHYNYPDTSGSVDIHSLESIGGRFYIYRINYYSDCVIQKINATRLQTLGSLYFQDLDYGSSKLAVAELYMPSLTTIQGQLYLHNVPALTTAYFDSLTAIQGQLYLYNVPGLTTAYFGNLTTIHGQLYIAYVTSLSTLPFGSLRMIRGSLYMSEAGALTTLAFDNLAVVEGYLYISGCTLLGTAYFGSLASVGVDLSDDNSGSGSGYYYSSSQTTVLCDVSGEYENVCIRDNAALETIAFRSLEYGSFDIATPSGAPV